MHPKHRCTPGTNESEENTFKPALTKGYHFIGGEKSPAFVASGTRGQKTHTCHRNAKGSLPDKPTPLRPGRTHGVLGLPGIPHDPTPPATPDTWGSPAAYPPSSGHRGTPLVLRTSARAYSLRSGSPKDFQAPGSQGMVSKREAVSTWSWDSDSYRISQQEKSLGKGLSHPQQSPLLTPQSQI